MADLKRSLKLFDGLAMVVGIMVGSGIFRTPGLVAAQLGRPWLTFVAWVLGGPWASRAPPCSAEPPTPPPGAAARHGSFPGPCGRRAGSGPGWVARAGRP